MHPYLESIYQALKTTYYYQAEYLQAVLEFLESIDGYVKEHPKIIETDVIKRIVEPDTSVSFKVIWEDDQGKLQTNKGFKVQFNQALGPYKGGLRFHPKVDESTFKFLAFEQTLKNALTGLPMGGSKGGADFDPRGKSKNEKRRFAQSFMIELLKYSGDDYDIPAADYGVTTRDIGYMFGMYKRITKRHNGIITSKHPSYGGSFVRAEATGYGLVYMTEHLLKTYFNEAIKDQRFIVSGLGNVSLPALEKIQTLGGKVVGVSSLSGVLHSEKGFDLDLLRQIKDEDISIETYVKKYPQTKYFKDTKALWKIPAHIALPCATQNELELIDVKHLVQNEVKAVLEGANMPTTHEAVHYLISNKILLVPGKAANAGGVSVSGLEMTQNAMHTQWTFDEVDQKLRRIMKNIFDGIYELAQKLDEPYNLVKAANLSAFEKLYEAMLYQGL